MNIKFSNVEQTSADWLAKCAVGIRREPVNIFLGS